MGVCSGQEGEGEKPSEMRREQRLRYRKAEREKERGVFDSPRLSVGGKLVCGFL